MSLNVFGPTLIQNGGAGTPATNGRGHNPNHQVSITIGNAFKAGVVGGVMPVADDIGCTCINPSTGAIEMFTGEIPLDPSSGRKFTLRSERGKGASWDISPLRTDVLESRTLSLVFRPSE